MNSESSAELFAKKAYTAVQDYFAITMEPNKRDQVLTEFHAKFPTWTELWKVLQMWLYENPLRAMRHSIHSFAKMFPNYNSFSQELDNSLIVDEPFWNEVHVNLCKAKGQLIC